MPAKATAISPVLFEWVIFIQLIQEGSLYKNNGFGKPLLVNYDWGELGFKLRTDYSTVIRDMVNDISFRSLYPLPKSSNN